MRLALAFVLVVLAALVAGGSSSAQQAHCCCTALAGNCPTPTPHPTATASPTPTPAPTPTPTPTPSPTPTPGAITTLPSPFPGFTSFGQSQTASATEQWFSGSFTYSGCATPSPLASIAPASGTGPTASFNITALANGTCTITVTGFGGNTAPILVTIATPTPPATPTPSPSPTASPNGTYEYPGASGPQIYNGAAGVPDPTVNGNISGLSPDANSASVLSATSGGVLFSNANPANLEIVNIGTHLTPMVPVGTVPGGHSPPISKGAFGGGTGAMIEWQNGFLIEGRSTTGCSGDAHFVVFDTDPTSLNYGYVFEGGGACWNGTTFKAYNGLIDNVTAGYVNQGTPWQQNKGDNWSVAGIPGLGFTDYGEDATLTAINHPLQVIFPTSVMVCFSGCGTRGTNYSPGTGGDGSCHGGPTACFYYGDILRIKSCAGQTGLTLLVCTQMQNYGIVASDTGSTPTIRMGLAADGSNPWPSALFVWLRGLSLSGNFDLMPRNCCVP